ncbi:hypothetical protein DLAC_04968 [Tieghemostelium lacteum]|uniref:Cytochrome P450 family protein n=1 Tax=Tieghemostelium lacteum TaxID=361077 RepID=A0A151ZI57_TIELA|nr:hypothetical protein DLAC_04968 [Tieghemostelium lacteum]|eukprot:KYQ93595.1 hypothetical protein DLAC_04968 [Tieghemostelium lacteum]
MSIFVILGILFLLYLIKDFISKNRNISQNPKVRGPLSLPLLGSLWTLGKLPHEDFSRLSERYGNIMSFYMGDTYTLVITCPDMLREIFVKNFDSFVERTRSPIFKKVTDNYRNFISGDESYWRPFKAMLANSFTKQTLKNHVTKSIDDQTQQLVDVMNSFAETSEPFAPKKFLERYTFNIITKYVMDEQIPYGQEEMANSPLVKLFDHFSVILKQLGSANLADFVNVLKPFYEFYLFHSDQPFDHITKFLRGKTEEIMKTYKPNVTRHLMDHCIAELGTESEHAKRSVTNITSDLLVAGAETSNGTLQWCLLMLANNPNYQEKCHQEVYKIGRDKPLILISDRTETPFTQAFIKEVMRIHPIGPLGLPRRAKEDIWVQDVFIPKDTQIIQNIRSLLQSEQYWDDPLTFKPERFLHDIHSQHFVPFGVGPRMCIGMTLANEEIYSAMANIILNFKISPLNGIEKIDESEVFGLTIHPNAFQVKLEKRIK